jgi:predicted RNA-binding Zn ribbon-like protein
MRLRNNTRKVHPCFRHRKTPYFRFFNSLPEQARKRKNRRQTMNAARRIPTDATQSGHPFLAFVNTVTDDGKRRERDSFENGAELLAELKAAGLEEAREAPGPGQLRTLRHLREAGYSVLSAIAAGRRPPHEDRLALEAAIKSAMSDATLVFGGARSRWRCGPLGGLHDALALAAEDLLQSADLSRLRECRRCTHLFLDHGRGTGRRWCSMARCGNRAKAQSFRERRRSAA